TPASHLQNSIPLRVLHVPSPAACLQSSGNPYLYTSTSLRQQRTSRPLHLYVPRPAVCLPSSRPPYLYTSTCLHVPGPAECLISSRSPCLLRVPAPAA